MVESLMSKENNRHLRKVGRQGEVAEKLDQKKDEFPMGWTLIFLMCWMACLGFY